MSFFLAAIFVFFYPQTTKANPYYCYYCKDTLEIMDCPSPAYGSYKCISATATG